MKTGDSVNIFLAFARYRGLVPIYVTGTWGLRPRLYAYACFAGLGPGFDELLTLFGSLKRDVVNLFVRIFDDAFE